MDFLNLSLTKVRQSSGLIGHLSVENQTNSDTRETAAQCGFQRGITFKGDTPFLFLGLCVAHHRTSNGIRVLPVRSDWRGPDNARRIMASPGTATNSPDFFARSNPIDVSMPLAHLC
jgi:hypothetical protein